MKKALVLGCGMIGKTIALDLAQDFDVTITDYSKQALDTLADRPDIEKKEGSAADLDFLTELVKEADVVCGALPLVLLGAAQKRVIELGKDYVGTIGFDAAEGLDEIAKSKGVTGVCDMGVAPGMSNYLLARGANMLDELDEGLIYASGIPQKLDPPFNYRTVFCLEDTLNMYMHTVRYIEDGKLTTAPALTGIEEVEIPGVGTLEAFYTDGLRSAAYNVKGKFIAEKTMRWPGYAAALGILIAAGFLDAEPVDVKGAKVSPRDVAAAVLRPRWAFRPEKGDRDYTIMRVITRGPKGKDRVTYTWDMVDRLDEKTMLHSMARTTGYPCAILARAIANGMVERKGFLAPELLPTDDAFYRFLIDEHKKRGIEYRETITTEIL